MLRQQINDRSPSVYRRKQNPAYKLTTRLKVCAHAQTLIFIYPCLLYIEVCDIKGLTSLEALPSSVYFSDTSILMRGLQDQAVMEWIYFLCSAGSLCQVYFFPNT